MRRVLKNSFAWIAIDYAKKITTGKINACWQVRAAARRMLDDLERDDLHLNIDRVEHVCAFVSALPHVIGPLSGQPIKLEAFQIFILANLFGFIDKTTGLRKYREAFILLPRGNAKSTLAAAIALYMNFCLGQGGAEGYSGATSLDQANAVFLPAKAMVEETPDLQRVLGLEVAARSIYQPSTRSSFKPVRAQTKDGGLPWIAICDELHQAINNVQIEAFRKGMGKRRGADPLLLIISTAGTNLAGVCRQEQVYFEGVLSGTIRDDAKFAIIYTIDDEDDWRDFKVWKKANPAYGVSVDEGNLRREYEKALQSPAAQADCLTKYLNVWVASATGWLNRADWANAADPLISYEELRGRPAGIGVDLSTQLDLTAVVATVVREDGVRVIIPYMWVPTGSIDRSPNKQAYQQWIASNHLIASDGAAIDFAEIQETIEALCEHFSVSTILFDPSDAAQMQQDLLKKGLPVQTFRQNAMNYTPVMRQVEAELVSGKLFHPGNPALDWCGANLSVRSDRNSNMHPQQPDKQDHLKIDGMIAALMAHAASQDIADPEPIRLIMLD